MVALQRIIPRGWDACIVAATGPSLTESVAAQCRGRPVIAVNDAYRRLPFADVLYACDDEWWDVHHGCPDFTGEKWSTHRQGTDDKLDCAARWGLRLVAGYDGEGFSVAPDRLHYGMNSGFQGINLALLFGATTVLLVGFDMRTTVPRHFFGDHPPGLKNGAKYEHFRSAFNQAARMLPPHITILNCTPGSALDCWPILPLEEALCAMTPEP